MARHPGKRGARGPKSSGHIKHTHTPVKDGGGHKGGRIPSDGHAMKRPTMSMKEAQSDTAPVSRAAKGRRNARLEKMEI